MSLRRAVSNRCSRLQNIGAQLRPGAETDNLTERVGSCAVCSGAVQQAIADQLATRLPKLQHIMDPHQNGCLYSETSAVCNEQSQSAAVSPTCTLGLGLDMNTISLLSNLGSVSAVQEDVDLGAFDHIIHTSKTNRFSDLRRIPSSYTDRRSLGIPFQFLETGPESSKSSCVSDQAFDPLTPDPGLGLLDDCLWLPDTLDAYPAIPHCGDDAAYNSLCVAHPAADLYDPSEESVTDSSPVSPVDWNHGTTQPIIPLYRTPDLPSSTSERHSEDVVPIYFNEKGWPEIGGDHWMPPHSQSHFTKGRRNSVTQELETRFRCTVRDCKVTLKNSTDLPRHLNSVHYRSHRKGTSYRCAFEGCPKAYKVWTRLDSFKKHARQHGTTNMDNLVRASCIDRQKLLVSVMTLDKMSQLSQRSKTI